MTLTVVILAAGKGTRMKSALPKVLHPIGGCPMLVRVSKTAYELGADNVLVVYSDHREAMETSMADWGVKATWVKQAKPQGTGHALAQAVNQLPEKGHTLVLYGDVPLISAEGLSAMCANRDENGLVVMSGRLDNPTGYGRLIRDESNNVVKNVEEKDASNEQKAIQEVFMGPMLLANGFLHEYIGQLNNDNAQQEYYLPDLIEIAAQQGLSVRAVETPSMQEMSGVNTRGQLMTMERYYQGRFAERLMDQGVSLIDASRFDCRGELIVGTDVTIDINAVFEGKVSIGSDVVIGANCFIKNASIADGAVIHPYSHIENAEIGASCVVGPYARLRPGTRLEEGARVGNFVEMKNAELGAGAKANHLAYVGDATVGSKSNIGAGVIVSNYDGKNKFRTEIGEGAFIGSNSVLIAPVVVGDDAFVAAGSAISNDAPAGKLSIARGRQTVIEHWSDPRHSD